MKRTCMWRIAGIGLMAQLIAALLLTTGPASAESLAELSRRVDEIRREARVFKLETQRLLLIYVQRHLAACGQEMTRVQQRWRDLEEAEARIRGRIATAEKVRRERELTPLEAREAAEDDDSGRLEPASEMSRVLNDKRQLAGYQAFLENEINTERHRHTLLQSSVAALEIELEPSRSGASAHAR